MPFKSKGELPFFLIQITDRSYCEGYGGALSATQKISSLKKRVTVICWRQPNDAVLSTLAKMIKQASFGESGIISLLSFASANKIQFHLVFSDIHNLSFLSLSLIQYNIVPLNILKRSLQICMQWISSSVWLTSQMLPCYKVGGCNSCRCTAVGGLILFLFDYTDFLHNIRVVSRAGAPGQPTQRC